MSLLIENVFQSKQYGACDEIIELTVKLESDESLLEKSCISQQEITRMNRMEIVEKQCGAIVCKLKPIQCSNNARCCKIMMGNEFQASFTQTNAPEFERPVFSQQSLSLGRFVNAG